MITIDVSEMKDERDRLAIFLKSEHNLQVEAKGKSLVIQSGARALTSGDMKALVKRFLHRNGMSEDYRVTVEGELLRVTKRKHGEGRRREPEGTGPSSYSTVPYYFPNPP